MPTSHSHTSRLRRYAWPALAVASIILNFFLVITFLAVGETRHALINFVKNQNCSTDGYAELMKEVGESAPTDQVQAKKLAAAEVCFVDYETGKQIDLDSVQPLKKDHAKLPPKL